MAFDENLADRIRLNLKTFNIRYKEKNMMGGLTFMVNDKMCVGIIKNDLMARIDPEIYEEQLLKDGCKEMDFTGRPMKGYVMLDPVAVDMDEDLDYWINLALEFNPKAKANKKKKK